MSVVEQDDMEMRVILQQQIVMVTGSSIFTFRHSHRVISTSSGDSYDHRRRETNMRNSSTCLQ